ncbi:hypothetical protein LTS10_005132 [Elasticomyces elasticus]|nr:hypothetical protein LTS10_005132 [Elasticomyces elasticus]
MDELPPEMLELVARECDFASLKQLRLVNKHISTVTTPIVFEHSYMGYFPYCLESFCELARSPLAKHVKAFTFFADLIPDWGRWNWQARVNATPGFTVETAIFYSDDQLEEAWKRYEVLRASQLSWTEQDDSFTFKRHFDMLPNVNEAHLVHANMSPWTQDPPPVWKTIREVILVSPWDWRSIERNSRNRNNLLEGQPALCLFEAIGYRARSSDIRQITTLTIHRKHYQSYMDLYGTTFAKGGNGRTEPSSPAHYLRYRDILEAFKPLEEIRFAHFEARGVGVAAAQELSNLLRQAKKLRRLDVRFGQYNVSADSRGDQEEATSASLEASSDPSGHWPDLKHLSLNMNVTYPGFLEFLRQHRATLRSLELRNMIVGKAPALLHEIPKVLRLDHVDVSEIWSANPDHIPNVKGFAYNAYVTSGTGKKVDSTCDKPDYNGVYENAVKEYLLRQRQELPELKIEGRNGMGSVNSEAESSEDDEDDEDEDEDDE